MFNAALLDWAGYFVRPICPPRGKDLALACLPPPGPDRWCGWCSASVRLSRWALGMAPTTLA